MYTLSDKQIDLILSDIGAHGIETESLRYNLLDHICILIEQGLEEGGDFEKFYSSVIKAFYKKELREIEEETDFLLTCRNHRVLTRNQFFAFLFALSIGPFIVYDILCLGMVNMGFEHRASRPEDILLGTFVFALYPLLTFLIILLTPDRFDPLVPKGSRVMIGINPLVKILPPEFPGEPAFS
jgi:hypothetical protein